MLLFPISNAWNKWREEGILAWYLSFIFSVTQCKTWVWPHSQWFHICAVQLVWIYMYIQMWKLVWNTFKILDTNIQKRWTQTEKEQGEASRMNRWLVSQSCLKSVEKPCRFVKSNKLKVKRTIIVISEFFSQVSGERMNYLCHVGKRAFRYKLAMSKLSLEIKIRFLTLTELRFWTSKDVMTK